ncbi:hypothetical protein SAMN00777080_3407 [Aquiflexum balticum DSM 16537]|uniref:Uncharacterized protein n=1 Tax=Aquiflexum balticum DSM 16537 TaxID=758820 RepID=A0A1W2H787_9BACT|nr:hypothetical protein [Aquiflexum balticum]SMD44773.1 hypothetical protein SAMN00777080_3407 [Aquiflexum balticum DSM 16537]
MDEFSFGKSNFDRILRKIGLKLSEKKELKVKVLIAVGLCWLPLVILSLIHGNFWTGSIEGSFITSAEAQTRFLISLPILILAEPLVGGRLIKTLVQFLDSGLIPKNQVEEFKSIVKKKTNFLQNPWTDIFLLVICYIQVGSILFFEAQYTSVAAWQFGESNGEAFLNIVGKWAVIVSRPITLFLIYRWILRVLVWGRILAGIAKLNLYLSPFHADKAGGLGFLAFSISYFSPVCFAISVSIAGNMADLMLVDGMKLIEFRLILLGYLLFIAGFFTYPLFVFSKILLDFKEKCIFELYDGIQHVYNKVDLKTLHNRNPEGENAEDISYVASFADFNAVLENVMNMRLLPFQIRDLLPLMVLTLVPFLFVILIEIPVSEIISRLINTLF